jgi:hypothetical protein
VQPLRPLVAGGSIQGNRLAPVATGLGMTLSFAAIGVFLGALGPALSIDRATIRTAGAAMMIAFALVMLVPALSERFSRWMLPIASSANAKLGAGPGGQRRRRSTGRMGVGRVRLLRRLAAGRGGLRFPG